MTWGSWLKPRDASGRESRTLAFVGISWLAMLVRFICGGMRVSWGNFSFEVASTSTVDFGAAVAAVLAIWLGREWIRSKTTKGKTDD